MEELWSTEEIIRRDVLSLSFRYAIEFIRQMKDH